MYFNKLKQKHVTYLILRDPLNSSPSRRDVFFKTEINITIINYYIYTVDETRQDYRNGFNTENIKRICAIL